MLELTKQTIIPSLAEQASTGVALFFKHEINQKLVSIFIPWLSTRLVQHTTDRGFVQIRAADINLDK